MIFSEKLVVLRKNKGMTQDALAEKLNVSRQAVAKWESGQ
ncbi:MAG: helix-turn-helix transcriptional regulator, partial [Treponema sp.]|nr:helix-turn-helix transcriptional regulator [Treponema sp.]